MPAALEVSDEPPLHVAEVSRSSIAYLATAARLTSAVYNNAQRRRLMRIVDEYLGRSAVECAGSGYA